MELALLIIVSIFYILLGVGVVAGVNSVKEKMGWFEGFFIILFWPPILLGLIVKRLVE